MSTCSVTFTIMTGQQVTAEVAISESAEKRLRECPVYAFDVCYTFRNAVYYGTIDREKDVIIKVNDEVIKQVKAKELF